MRKFLASVGNAKLLGKKNGELYHIADVRTLTESTLSFSNTMEEVRAGEGAQLFGRFSHDSGLAIQLTDALFDLNYVALQVGTSLDAAGPMHNGFYQETFDSAHTASTLTLGKTAVKIGNACGLDKIVVWMREKGCESTGEWTAVVTESGTSVDVPTALQGKDLCVEYFVNKPEASAIFVNANFIPAELVLILTTKLFAGDANAPETGKPVGSITVKIPRFSLDGQFDLSMAMSAAATMSLNGTALAVDDGTCDGKGIYAEIVEVITDSTVLTGLKDIIIDEDSIATNTVPKVYGLYDDGHIAAIDEEFFTVANSGGNIANKKPTAAGTYYVTVSPAGTAFSTNGTTVQDGYTGEFKIDTITL